jgi:ankyrin repeat protein
LDEGTLAFAGRVFDLARGGYANELADLLGQGVPANLTNDKGDTLLILAAYHGRVEAVEMLLKAGADPERANDRGQTALAGASFKGDLATVRCLLEGGARVHGAGHDGRTALMVAAMFDRTQITDLLLTHGADPDLRDSGGRDASDLAAAMNAYGTPSSTRESASGAKREQDCRLGLARCQPRAKASRSALSWSAWV